MPSERYETLQDDLDSLLEELDASLEWFTKKNTNPNEVQSGLERCQGQVDEARKYLRDLKQEARRAPLAYKSEMLSKVRTYQETVAKVQRKVRLQKSESYTAIDSHKQIKHEKSGLLSDGEDLVHSGTQVTKGASIFYSIPVIVGTLLIWSIMFIACKFIFVHLLSTTVSVQKSYKSFVLGLFEDISIDSFGI